MAHRQHSLLLAEVHVRRRDRKADEPIGGLKLADLEFEVDPAAVAAIDQDLDGLYRRNVGNDNIPPGSLRANRIKHVVVKDVVIVEGETPVAHGFGYIPNFFYVTPTGGSVVTWKQAQPSDNVNVYIKAGAQFTADVKIEG